MSVQDAVQVILCHENHQFVLQGEFDFLPGLAQLGRNEREAQCSVDTLFRCLRDDALFLAQAVVIERHAFLLRQFGECFDVLVGPSREQERDAVTLGAGDVDGQFAVLDCFGFAAMLWIDGDKRQIADEFATAAEVARRCNVGPVRMQRVRFRLWRIRWRRPPGADGVPAVGGSSRCLAAPSPEKQVRSLCGI